MKRNYFKSILAVVITTGLLLSNQWYVYAEEEGTTGDNAIEETVTEETSTGETATEEKIENLQETHIELSVQQNTSSSKDGNQVRVNAIVYDAFGDEITDGKLTVSYKYASSSNTKSVPFNINNLKDGTYEVYAEYEGTEDYKPSNGTLSFDVHKFTSLKDYLLATPTPEGESLGSITVKEDYPDYNLINELTYYTNAYNEKTVEGKDIYGLSEGKYYVSIPARQDGNTIYIFSGNQQITVNEGEAIKIFKVSTQEDENISWTKSSFEQPENKSSTFTTYVKLKDASKSSHYISAVEASPAENADVSFNSSTGEVQVSNIKGDLTLKAVVNEKEAVSSLQIEDIQVSENQNYSEENPSIQYTIKLKALDENGLAVSNETIYYKNDENEVSYTQARTTDENGIAEFKYSYGIEEDEVNADYKAQFALTNDFNDILLEQEIHLILQKKEDLILYENQIIGTQAGENDGKVIDVPDNYEIWTGETHQGALVVGSGIWQKAVDGQFTGLNSGQHLLRAGEKFDKATASFYFASDYADFFVPRGQWSLTVDAAASENVTFTGDLLQAIAPGSTVYVYVKAKDGYEIKDTGIIVDKPSYLSDVPYYDEEGAYIVLGNVSGSLTLKVIASPKAAEANNDETTEDSANSSSSNSQFNSETSSSDASISNSTSSIASSSSSSSTGSTTSSSSSSSTTSSATGSSSTSQSAITIADDQIPLSATVTENTAIASTPNLVKNKSASTVVEADDELTVDQDEQLEITAAEEEAKISNEQQIDNEEVPLAANKEDESAFNWYIIILIAALIVLAGVTIYKGYQVKNKKA